MKKKAPIPFFGGGGKMRNAKYYARAVLEILLLLFILGVGANLIDDKMSRQLDNVDPTNEEMTQQVPFRK